MLREKQFKELNFLSLNELKKKSEACFDFSFFDSVFVDLLSARN